MAIRDSWVMPVIAVDDIDRAASFYRDTLGFSITTIEEDPTSRLVEVGHGYFLLYKSEFRRGETTVASFMVKDVEGTVSELRGRGVTFEEYDLPGLKTVDGVATLGEMQSAWFKDTEGNVLAITTEVAKYMREAA
jgi:catechol 2,3-dioxygenase-like lactoylglutathione lyase family enzyme